VKTTCLQKYPGMQGYANKEQETQYCFFGPFLEYVGMRASFRAILTPMYLSLHQIVMGRSRLDREIVNCDMASGGRAESPFSLEVPTALVCPLWLQSLCRLSADERGKNRKRRTKEYKDIILHIIRAPEPESDV